MEQIMIRGGWKTADTALVYLKQYQMDVLIRNN